MTVCKCTISSTWVCVLAETYGCLCALSGQLALRISAFHSDYTSALIPVGTVENLGTSFYRDAVEGMIVSIRGT